LSISKVGEAGHDGGRLALRLVQQAGHQSLHFAVDQVDLVAQPQADVGGHLVVAGAAGVQLLAGDADLVGEARLDVHVHVFQRHRPFEFTGLDLGADLIQTLDDGVALLAGEHAGFREHGGVGLGALDVLAVHAAVKADAGGERLHEGVGGLAEAAAPELVLLVVAHLAAHVRLAGIRELTGRAV
jgi:hypothetical protein